MKILITGGDGKIGLYLAKHLPKDWEYYGLGIKPLEADPNNYQKYYQADITDSQLITKIVKELRPNCIIHLAGVLGPFCEANPLIANKINVTATRHLAKLAIKYGVEKFVFASSSAIYNQTALNPVTEELLIDPRCVYGRTKLLAELSLQKLTKNNPLTKFCVLRFFNVYGDLFTESLIYKLIHSSKENPAIILNPATYFRDYIHISDVSQSIKKAIITEFNSSLSIFNIGSGRVISTVELMQELKSIGKIVFIKELITDDPPTYSWANIEKAESVLDFEPHKSIIIE